MYGAKINSHLQSNSKDLTRSWCKTLVYRPTAARNTTLQCLLHQKLTGTYQSYKLEQTSQNLKYRKLLICR